MADNLTIDSFAINNFGGTLNINSVNIRITDNHSTQRFLQQTALLKYRQPIKYLDNLTRSILTIPTSL